MNKLIYQGENGVGIRHRDCCSVVGCDLLPFISVSEKEGLMGIEGGCRLQVYTVTPEVDDGCKRLALFVNFQF